MSDWKVTASKLERRLRSRLRDKIRNERIRILLVFDEVTTRAVWSAKARFTGREGIRLNVH